MLKNFRNSMLVLCIAAYLVVFWTSPAMAGLMGSRLSDESGLSRTRQMEIHKIQRALENQIVTDKLQAYGLKPFEIKDKISQMNDHQIHLLAQASDSVLAGGDGIGFIVGVLLIVFLVIVILRLLNKEIIVR